jgi:hypothetical protein
VLLGSEPRRCCCSINPRSAMKSAFPRGDSSIGRTAGVSVNSTVLNAADRPDRRSFARVGHPVGAASITRRIEDAIPFRAETIGEPLVWSIGGHPQFGALYLESPVVDTACGCLSASCQQQDEKENRRTHSSPGSINDHARLAQLAPPLKSMRCRTAMPRPLRCRRPRGPKSPAED